MSAGRSRIIKRERLIVSTEEILALKKEGGKKITVKSFGNDVVVTVWRKNDGVLLPLVLNRMEAQKLHNMLLSAIEEATRSA